MDVKKVAYSLVYCIVFCIIYHAVSYYIVRYKQYKIQEVVMARVGITYEQVAAAASALLGEGRQPTIQAIRGVLGTGSPNTIHRHLCAYNEGRPPAAQMAVEVPAELTAAFLSALDRTAAAARAEKENQIVALQFAADELSAAGEALEIERDELAAQVLNITTERDRLDAVASERQSELHNQTALLASEREKVEKTHIEIAQLRNKIESMVERLAAQSTELQEVRKLNSALEKEKVAAEQAAAVAIAKLEAAAVRYSDLNSRFELLCTDLKETNERAKKAEASLGTERSAVQAGNARYEAIIRENVLLQEAANNAKESAKVAGEEAAELRGQLSAFKTASPKK